MPLRKKLTKVAAILRHGRGWLGKYRMFQVFCKHGGLGAFGGIDQILSIPTNSPNAPVLHMRDTGSDGVVFTEILVDEDYASLRTLNLKPSCIFDIGANIGVGSFYLRTLFPEATLFGFEPSPSEKAIAEKNYASWGNATLFGCALGEQNIENATFAVHADRTGGQHLLGDSELGDWNAISVAVRRLDSIIAEDNLPVPELVKMDIEGGEVQALRGFGDLLTKVQAFIIETHSADLHRDCLSILQQAGFSTVVDFPRAQDARILCMVRRS